MISESGEFILCDEKGCVEKIKNHAWGKIKSGWLEMKDGRAFCTKHLPAWYKKAKGL